MCIHADFSVVNVINVSMCKHGDGLTYFSAQMLSKLITVIWKRKQQTLNICSSLNLRCSQFREHLNV